MLSVIILLIFLVQYNESSVHQVDSISRHLTFISDDYIFSKQCSESIVDKDSCIKAAPLCGLTFNGGLENDIDSPSGCFKGEDDGVYWNENEITECSKEYQCVCSDLSDSTYRLITSGYCSDHIGADGRSLDSLGSPELCTIYYQYEVYWPDPLSKKEAFHHNQQKMADGSDSFFFAYGDEFIFKTGNSISEILLTEFPSGCVYVPSEKKYVFNAYLSGGYRYKESSTLIYNLCNADNLFSVVTSNTCTLEISTPGKCASAAQNSGYYYAGLLDAKTTEKGSYPSGCFFNSIDGYVYFNEYYSTISCSIKNFCFCFNTLYSKNTCSEEKALLKDLVVPHALMGIPPQAMVGAVSVSQALMFSHQSLVTQVVSYYHL